MKYVIAVFSMSLLFASSCKLPQAVQLPDIKEMPDSVLSPVDTHSIANLSWKNFFSDLHLARLIDTALANNPDLAIATQRIEAAKAELYASAGYRYPSVDATLSAGVEKYGDYTMNGVGNFDTNLSPNISKDQKIPRHPTPDFFIGLRSSWEIDLWGRFKSLRKAASFRLLASEKGRQLAITDLVASVAELYYELLALDYELEIVRKNVVLQEEALEIITIQKEDGSATALAVHQFAAQLLNTRTIEFNIRQERVVVENQLNMLLGRYPQPVMRDTSLINLEIPAGIRPGSSAQLLIRRPDIRQAELELQASKADLAAARAAFLPALNLSPYLGLQSFKAGLLFNPGSIATGVIAGMSAPILNRRKLDAGYNVTAAQQKTAAYQFQKTLLSAYNEIMTNLSYIENNRQTFALKNQEVKELSNAVGTARELYLAGYANYLEVVTAQKGVLEAELELAENKKRLLHGTVRLYRSLGGGWY